MMTAFPCPQFTTVIERLSYPARPASAGDVQSEAVSDEPQAQPEFDVFLCCADPSDDDVVATVAAYLRRCGFRVYLEDRSPADVPEERRLALAGAVPDFLLLLTPASVDAMGAVGRGMHAEIERALETARNVVLVAPSGAPAPPAGAFPPSFSSLRTQNTLAYNPDRLAESLSIIQHSLSSDTTVGDRHLMRRTRRLFIGVAIFVLAAASLQIVPLLVKKLLKPKPLPPVAPFALYWAGFGQRVDASGAAGFPLVDGVSLAGGDHLTVAFSPSADGYAYVIAKDTRGRVSVLFPAETMKGASRVRAGRTYRAPVESGWLTVDPQAGIDTIYVFAGYDLLQNLEELVEEPETPQNAAARGGLVEQTVNGLIDGRHYQFGRRPWIRNMQFVEQSLKPAPGPATFSASFPGGTSATQPAVTQPGLVSALVEIKVRFTAPAGVGRK